jgi:plastocyanin
MSISHRSRTATLAAALTLAASATLTVFAMPPASAAATVRGAGTHWSPATTTIAAGGTVRWRSTSGTHRIKAYGTNWSYLRNLPQGTTTAARAFNHRGTFRFYCTIHGYVAGNVCSGMCGKIVVH